jgi:hypothetical protein
MFIRAPPTRSLRIPQSKALPRKDIDEKYTVWPAIKLLSPILRSFRGGKDGSDSTITVTERAFYKEW